MEIKTSDWLTRGISPKQLKKEKEQAFKEYYKFWRKTNKKKLEHGIVKEFKDGTTLWYQPIDGGEDGFVLRDCDRNIMNVWNVNSCGEFKE